MATIDMATKEPQKPTEPFKTSAVDLAAGVRSGAVKADDVASFYSERTEKLRKSLGTHLFFDASLVDAQLSALKKRLDAGEDLTLAGVPILLKDNLCATPFPTTCASKILADYRPPYDAHVVTKLRQAGAVLFGKANLDEFSMGSSGENSSAFVTRNPWDTNRVPGGSSSGSAAAVAADLVPVALGSDTGGSIRQPASFCGVVGMKPTYGRVSRYGLVAFASSLDQIGPFARTTEDCAALLDVISGHDSRDSTSAKRESTQGLLTIDKIKKEGRLGDLKGMRIGRVREGFPKVDSGAKDSLSGVSGSVLQSVEATIAMMADMGATIVDVSLPTLDIQHVGIAAYYLLATAEASANLARFDGIRYGHRTKAPRESMDAGGSGSQSPGNSSDLSLDDVYRQSRSEGFGREVKQRIMLGTFCLSSGYYDAYYGKAEKARQLLGQEFRKCFEAVDALVLPTTPTTAFTLGEKTADPLAMYLSDVFTIGANLAGLPAISIPCGLDDDALPIGCQLVGRPFGDEELLGLAFQMEKSLSFAAKNHAPI